VLILSQSPEKFSKALHRQMLSLFAIVVVLTCCSVAQCHTACDDDPWGEPQELVKCSSFLFLLAFDPMF
jgi:hypothetical protein